MAGKGGGAWKVAYADFVTAMMAFFMVMWLIAQKDSVKQAVANSFRNPNSLYATGDALLAPQGPQYFKDRRPTSERSPSPTSHDAVSTPSRRPYSLGINNGSRTVIGTVILFSPESTELDEAARQQLTGLVPLIVGKPQKIEIRGHANDRLQASSGQATNAWAVSYARAMSVMSFLLENKIPANRIRLSQAGSTEPYRVTNAAEDAGLHARAEVFLLNEVTEDAVGTRQELERRFKSP